MKKIPSVSVSTNEDQMSLAFTENSASIEENSVPVMAKLESFEENLAPAMAKLTSLAKNSYNVSMME